MKNREPFVKLEEDQSILQLKHIMDKETWLRAGFTTRLQGNSSHPYHSLNMGLHVGDREVDVIENRKKVLASQGFSKNQWVCANQTHGANLYHVTGEDGGKGFVSLNTAIEDVDALYTQESNLFLASFYADCVPLYVIDIEKKIVSIAHAGWRGTVAQIGVKLIKHWQKQFGSNLDDIRVFIGPAIGSCCYEVDEKVVNQFLKYETHFSSSSMVSNDNGKYMLDLKQINHDFFIKAGILAEHIEVSHWCTSCHSTLFFSHRRDKGKTGRMLAFIAIQEE